MASWLTLMWLERRNGMGRKSKQAEVTGLVHTYLRQGESLAPDQCILDVKHVA